MSEKTMKYFIDISKRDEFIKLASFSFSIPTEYQPYFSEAIKKYANANLSNEKVNEMIAKNQSFAQFINVIEQEKLPYREFDLSFSHWKGYFAEWVTCLEYNSLKNKGNVIMTIVNPDTTSKADLLHLVKTEAGFKVIAGPDVKTGMPEYVLTSYERLLNEKYDIPFLDAFGVITKSASELTRKQQDRLSQALISFPDKKPLSGLVSKIEYRRLMVDYLAYIKTGKLPSERINGDFKLPKSSGKIRELVADISNHENYFIKSWEHFKLDLSHKDTPDKIPTKKPTIPEITPLSQKNHNVLMIPTGKKIIPGAKSGNNKNRQYTVIKILRTVGRTAFQLLQAGSRIYVNERLVTLGTELIHRTITQSREQQTGSKSPSNRPMTPDIPSGFGSPKSMHPRAGHYRTLRDGRKIPISPTIVNRHKKD